MHVPCTTLCSLLLWEQQICMQKVLCRIFGHLQVLILSVILHMHAWGTVVQNLMGPGQVRARSCDLICYVLWTAARCSSLSMNLIGGRHACFITYTGDVVCFCTFYALPGWWNVMSHVTCHVITSAPHGPATHPQTV